MNEKGNCEATRARRWEAAPDSAGEKRESFVSGETPQNCRDGAPGVRGLQQRNQLKTAEHPLPAPRAFGARLEECRREEPMAAASPAAPPFHKFKTSAPPKPGPHPENTHLHYPTHLL